MHLAFRHFALLSALLVPSCVRERDEPGGHQTAINEGDAATSEVGHDPADDVQEARQAAAEACLSEHSPASDRGDPDPETPSSSAWPATISERELCAVCEALEGGETGDFVPNGQAGPPPPRTCDEDLGSPVQAPDAGADGASLLNAIELIEGTTRQSALWTEIALAGLSDEQLAEYDRGVFGFTPRTSVDLGIDVFEPRLLSRSVSTASTTDESSCPDRVRALADISLTTADGALSGTFSEAEVTLLSENEATATAVADLKDFRGCVDLGALPQEGIGARLNVFIWDDQVRGELRVGLRPTEPLQGLPGTHEQEWLLPLKLQWPNDDCPSDLFPTDGTGVGDALEQWLTGHPTEFTNLEFGTLTDACEGRERTYYGPGESRYAEFTLPVTLSWEGMEELTLAFDTHTVVRPDGTLERAYGAHLSGWMDVASFIENYGLDLDYGTEPDTCVRLAAKLWEREGEFLVRQSRCNDDLAIATEETLLEYMWSE